MPDLVTTIETPAPLELVLAIAQGPSGPAGASSSFTHIQTTASAIWVVNHNLGSRPNVSVLSQGGVEMLAEVIHISVNQVQIFFDGPQTGLAICS